MCFFLFAAGAWVATSAFRFPREALPSPALSSASAASSPSRPCLGLYSQPSGILIRDRTKSRRASYVVRCGYTDSRHKTSTHLRRAGRPS